LWLVFAAGLVGLSACKDSMVEKLPTDVAAVEQDVNKHLPIGSSRAQVAAYLDERGIVHSYFGEVTAAPQDNHTEIGLIKGATSAGLVRKDIQVRFKFDSEDSRLVSYTVMALYTGP
jgi:hypothetical protein